MSVQRSCVSEIPEQHSHPAGGTPEGCQFVTLQVQAAAKMHHRIVTDSHHRDMAAATLCTHACGTCCDTTPGYLCLASLATKAPCACMQERCEQAQQRIAATQRRLTAATARHQTLEQQRGETSRRGTAATRALTALLAEAPHPTHGSAHPAAEAHAYAPDATVHPPPPSLPQAVPTTVDRRLDPTEPVNNVVSDLMIGQRLEPVQLHQPDLPPCHAYAGQQEAPNNTCTHELRPATDATLAQRRVLGSSGAAAGPTAHLHAAPSCVPPPIAAFRAWQPLRLKQVVAAGVSRCTNRCVSLELQVATRIYRGITPNQYIHKIKSIL